MFDVLNLFQIESFANGACLLLLLLLIPYVVWYFMARRKEPTMSVPDTFAYRSIQPTLKQRLIHVPFFLRLLCLAMLIIVLARPQTSNHWKNSEVEGIDIMLAMDISTSMLANDLKPDRITAAKEVASQFVSNSENNNIGLTIFAAEAFTQCPLTTDHRSLLNMFSGVSCGLTQAGLIDDGTAIGMGLANAISRLKSSKAKSKVIILLTDGSNNKGEISPQTAADIAKLNNIRVYTIGVGTNGTAYYPQQLPGGGTYNIPIKVEIDTKTLEDIAKTTNGKFYRATSKRQLEEIYDEIGKLEKSKLIVKQYDKHYESYMGFCFVALLSLVLELILRYLVLKKIP